jgi:hypothetical protein
MLETEGWRRGTAGPRGAATPRGGPSRPRRLAALHDKNRAHAATACAALACRVGYLGNYVDRGFDSKELINLLLDRPVLASSGVPKGSQKDALLGFLDDPARGPDWFAISGDATVMSYGVCCQRAANRKSAPGRRATSCAA